MPSIYDYYRQCCWSYAVDCKFPSIVSRISSIVQVMYFQLSSNVVMGDERTSDTGISFTHSISIEEIAILPHYSVTLLLTDFVAFNYNVVCSYRFVFDRKMSRLLCNVRRSVICENVQIHVKASSIYVIIDSDDGCMRVHWLRAPARVCVCVRCALCNVMIIGHKHDTFNYYGEISRRRKSRYLVGIKLTKPPTVARGLNDSLHSVRPDALKSEVRSVSMMPNIILMQR